MSQPNSANGKAALSQKEAAFMLSIINHNKSKLEVDWDVVAAENGYKDAGIARTRFGQIKRRINESSATTSTTPSSSKSTGKASTKASGSGTNTNPSRVSKTKGAGRDKKVQDKNFAGDVEEDVDDDDEDMDADDDAETINPTTTLMAKFLEVKKEQAAKANNGGTKSEGRMFPNLFPKTEQGEE